jgi:hypothetical protein
MELLLLSAYLKLDKTLLSEPDIIREYSLLGYEVFESSLMNIDRVAVFLER